MSLPLSLIPGLMQFDTIPPQKNKKTAVMEEAEVCLNHRKKVFSTCNKIQTTFVQINLQLPLNIYPVFINLIKMTDLKTTPILLHPGHLGQWSHRPVSLSGTVGSRPHGKKS